jgi:hypothetical protein
MIDNIEHCAPLGNSDHEVLEFKFLYKNVNSYDRLRYFKGDYEAINEVLANVISLECETKHSNLTLVNERKK